MGDACDRFDSYGQPPIQLNSATGGPSVGGDSGFTNPAASQSDPLDVVSDFETIKETLKSVQLPNHLRVFYHKQGINADCQATNAVIGKCARYTETV